MQPIIAIRFCPLLCGLKSSKNALSQTDIYVYGNRVGKRRAQDNDWPARLSPVNLERHRSTTFGFFFFFLALHTFFFKGGTKEEQDQKWKRKRNKSLVGFSFISPVKQLSEKMKNKGEQTHISSKSSNGQWHSDIKRSSIYPAKRSKVADNSPASGWHTSSFNIIVWRSCVCRPLHVIHYSVGTVHTMERRHFSAAQLKVVRCHGWDRE